MSDVNNKSHLILYVLLSVVFIVLSTPGSIYLSSVMEADSEEIIIEPDLSEINALLEAENLTTDTTATQSEKVKEDLVPKALIKELTFISPSSETLCRTNNPWLLGEQVLETDSHISSTSCFGIKVTLTENVNYIVILKDTSNTLYKLSPNTCPNMRSEVSNNSIFIPTSTENKPSVFAVDSSSGEENFYLIAYSPTFDLEKHASDLVSIPDICSDQNAKAPDFSIESFLGHLRKTNPSNLDWKGFRLYH